MSSANIQPAGPRDLADLTEPEKILVREFIKGIRSGRFPSFDNDIKAGQDLAVHTAEPLVRAFWAGYRCRTAGRAQPSTTPETAGPRLLSEIAREIREKWTKVCFGAGPYLKAMENLRSIQDGHYRDEGRSIVNYFLVNANTWRGPDANRIKAELKALAKG